MKHLFTLFLSFLLLATGVYAGKNAPIAIGFAAGCQKIVLKSGDIIDAAISQITPTEVKYKPCNGDIEMVLAKKSILSITDEKGEVIYRDGTGGSNNGGGGQSANSDAKTDLWAILSVVEGGLSLLVSIFSGLGGILLGIGGIVWGILSLGRIKKNSALKGKGAAWAGIIMGALALLLGIIIIIIVL